jgi:hypothetical protein
MTDQPTITFDLPGTGVVTMKGTGPWVAYETGHAREIKDSTGQVANPTVSQLFSGRTMKPNANVTFAQPSITVQIVELANAKLAEATAA